MTNMYRKGMKLEAKLSNSVIILVNRASGNKHWNTKKVGSKNNHKIHEGTLDKFYTIQVETGETYE
tara:strand:+ start:552 stop:749 length:198 start_codon:yes stop_codon:yes gene_type:complete